MHLSLRRADAVPGANGNRVFRPSRVIELKAGGKRETGRQGEDREREPRLPAVGRRAWLAARQEAGRPRRGGRA